MDYLVVCTVALLAAGLTLVSGFGLGTLLMPAFAAFFPLPVAVAATAVVHLANNLFKVVLVGRHADRRTVVRFAVPAAAGAVAGALVLMLVSGASVLVRYRIGAHVCEVTAAKVVVAVVIFAFAVLELSPRFERLAFPAGWMPVGGALSGFFGGLSGHQGALRSAFLVRAGLSREAFIGTGVVSAVVVDVARLAVYAPTEASRWETLGGQGLAGLVAAASGAAFVGSFVGAKLVKKVTMRGVRLVVGVMLALMAVVLGAGVV